jgi:subtilisin-like proprotein convertase family protein
VAALGGLIAAAPLVGAQSSSPDRSPHLLLVPDTPRADAALDASSARTVARYDAFTLVEARGGDDADLRAAGADRRDDMRRVSLPGGSFDPVARESLAVRGAPDLDEALAIVQYSGPVKDAWLERLSGSGARIVQYLPQNGYLVHASGTEVDRLAGLVGTDTAVRAVTRVTAADKLSEEVARDPDVRRVAVQTLIGADGADARLDAAAAGPSMRGSSTVGELATQYLTLSTAEREALASDPAVVSISGYSRPRPLDERSAQIVAGNLLGGTPTGGGDYLNWLDSQGFGTGTLDFAIDIADSGVDTGSVSPMHPDFYENGVRPGTGSRIAYAHNFTADSNARDCIGHGSNVASIAGGYSVAGASRQDADLFRYGLGTAPQVKIGISKFFNCAGSFQFSTGGFDALADTAYAGGARISNHSWGNLDYGAYSADSQLFDSIVRDAQPGASGNQQMVEVLAAGNEADGLEDQPQAFPDEGWGSVASPGTAKNVITVGASESRRPLNAVTCGLDDGAANDADDIASFSSRGPTDDGRLKPDLVAPGTRITGAAPQLGAAYTGAFVCQRFFPSGNTLYNLESGTSQAAPAVSGAAALIRDWYTREHGPQAPSPALTKAIMVNTATDLVGGEDGRGDEVGPAPNVDQGWGRPHLGAVLDGTQRSYVDQTSVLGNTGARFARSYAVADSTRPLKVTVAWTDAPGMVSTEAFVNDLDLVVRQGGRTYKGNVLAGGRSITGGDADRRNNVESVVLPAGAQGPFSVEVLGTNVAGNGVPGVGDATDQDFALVVSNGHEQAAPVLAPESVTIHDPAPGDSDESLEPSEPFTLDVGLANGGDAAAPDVSGTIAGPGLTFSDNSTSWGDIGAGAVADSDSPMAGTLAPGSACGVDVEATLTLGSQMVPVILPTGQPGPPLTHTSPQSPAIPDNNPSGALATMTVSIQSRIKDLDVRVNIAHEWVGDLVIDLTSPQGTTVRLADHPGGPDNGGQNFSGTIFDDDAPVNISAASAPYTGRFRPQADQLSRFDGQRLNGTWTLRVRDLFEGKTGAIQSWGTTTSPAICDFDGSVLADTTPPETSVTAGPSGASASQAASFSFAANEPDVTFECGLDGGAFTPCNSTHSVGGLPEGPHMLRVRARDPANNVDPSPAEIQWTVDVRGPALSIGRPNAGDSLTDSTPPITGTAGVAPGDAGTVNVNLWRGSQPSGLPAQTLVVPRDAGSGAWSATPATLSDGTWTARVQQSDAAGNTGFSQPRTFSVDTTAPEFAIAPVEADRVDVLRGRLTVLAGCGTTCGVSAELRSTGRRPTVLGSASTTVGRNSHGTLRVRLTKKGRAAVRKAKKANLTATVAVGGRSRVVLKQPVTFRKLNLRRVASRGLSFAGQCAEHCSISASLLMRAGDAKRYGLRPPSSAPVPVAGGNASSAARTTLLTLRPNKASSRALRRARRLKMTFEAVVRASSGPSHRAAYALTLRR